MTLTYRTNAGDMLDEICHRHYGRASGAVEEVLVANPGLAAKGPVYPAGCLILLPELPPSNQLPTLKLWD